MRDLCIVLVSMFLGAGLAVSTILAAYEGGDVSKSSAFAKGQQAEREEAAKRHLAQFYLDPKTGKVDFQYLDLEAYTHSIIEQLVPQRVPGPQQ